MDDIVEAKLHDIEVYPPFSLSSDDLDGLSGSPMH